MFLPPKKLLLRYDVELCDGRHCPEELRESCYRYMLHHFYDKVAKRVNRECFFFLEPTPKDGVCEHWKRPQYQDKDR